MLWDLLKKRRLLGEIRFERRLSHGLGVESSPEVTPFPLERVSNGICLPPIWLSNSNKGVHQVNETGGGTSRENWNPSDYFLRRYPHHGEFKGTYSSSFPRSLSIKPSREPGVYCKLPKISTTPLKAVRVSRPSGGFRDLISQPPRREVKKDQEKV